MLSRRRFMFLLGGATTGIWLASTGLVRLGRNFMLSLAGECSFCGKAGAELRALVGTSGHPAKICDECVSLCLDIIGEDLGVQQPRDVHSYSPPNFDDEQFQQQVAETLRRLAERDTSLPLDSMLEDVRRSFDRNRNIPFDMFHCSFCDADRKDVARLISGPRVFICDRCVGDATAVVTHVLRPA